VIRSSLAWWSVDTCAADPGEPDLRASPPGRRAPPWCVDAAPVRDYMVAPVELVSPTEDVVRAGVRMRQRGVSCLVVAASGRAVGVLSRSDLGVRWPGDEATPVAALMTRRVLAIEPRDTVRAACRALIEHEIHQLVVFDGERPVGVVSRSDLVPAARDLRIADPIARWATPTRFVAEVDQPVRDVLALLARADLGALLVMDGRFPVGVFGRRESFALSREDLARPVEAVMSGAVLDLPADLPLHRAAAQIAATGAELAVVDHGGVPCGVLTPTDVVRAMT
jgi:CBS domain-containing protein